MRGRSKGNHSNQVRKSNLLNCYLCISIDFLIKYFPTKKRKNNDKMTMKAFQSNYGSYDGSEHESNEMTKLCLMEKEDSNEPKLPIKVIAEHLVLGHEDALIEI